MEITMEPTFNKSHRRDPGCSGIWRKEGFYMSGPDKAVFHLRMAFREMKIGVEVIGHGEEANF